MYVSKLLLVQGTIQCNVRQEYYILSQETIYRASFKWNKFSWWQPGWKIWRTIPSM